MAIKVIDLELDNAGIEEIRAEVSVLCHCDSPYIIRYYESYLIGSKLWIVMDYCGLGSLRQIIVKNDMDCVFINDLGCRGTGV